jgi:phage gp36-like protein
MAYATEANLQSRFGTQEIADLLDRDNNSTADTNALSSAQEDTDAIIDGYISGRYDTPLDPVPNVIVNIAANIVRYTLWGNNAPEEVRKRYEDSIKTLKDIQSGKFSLPADTTASESTGGIIYSSTYTRKFQITDDNDTLSDF